MSVTEQNSWSFLRSSTSRDNLITGFSRRWNMFASLNLTSFFFLFFFVVWGFESRRNREPSQTALNLTSWRIMGNGWGDDVSFLVSETRSLKFCWLFSRLIDYHLVYKMTDNWEKCPSQFSMSSKWRLQTASSAKNAKKTQKYKWKKMQNENQDDLFLTLTECLLQSIQKTDKEKPQILKFKRLEQQMFDFFAWKVTENWSKQLANHLILI